MATSTQQPAGEPAPCWVAVVTVAGLNRGMVGPFPTEEAAASWARGALGTTPGLGWRLDPVVAPAALSASAARRTRRRSHLSVVG